MQKHHIEAVDLCDYGKIFGFLNLNFHACRTARPAWHYCLFLMLPCCASGLPWCSLGTAEMKPPAALFSPLLENCHFAPLLPSSSEQATTSQQPLYITMNDQDATIWRMMDAAIQACWARKNTMFSTPKYHMNKIMNVQSKDLDFCISIGMQNHLLSYLASDNQILEHPDMIYSHSLLAWNAFQLLFKLTGVLGHWWASTADWADAITKISLFLSVT